MSQDGTLTIADRFEIFEQLNLHQRCIDGDDSPAATDKYIDLFWPEGSFEVHDIRHNTFKGPQGLQQLYEFAHRVFPLHQWTHSLGTFEIRGSGARATVEWRWIVSWKAEETGVVSTGSYSDLFEKREGVWKCLTRISNVDPNWPAAMFQSWIDLADKDRHAS